MTYSYAFLDKDDDETAHNYLCSLDVDARMYVCETTSILNICDFEEDALVSTIDDSGVVDIIPYECHCKTEDQSGAQFQAFYCPPANVNIDGSVFRANNRYVSDGDDETSAFVYNLLENGNIELADLAFNLDALQDEGGDEDEEEDLEYENGDYDEDEGWTWTCRIQ